MLGAFAAYVACNSSAELLVRARARAAGGGTLGIAIERLFLRHLYRLDPLYGLLLTFGIALIAEGIMRGLSAPPGNLIRYRYIAGGFNLGFMVLPIYRAWVVLAS